MDGNHRWKLLVKVMNSKTLSFEVINNCPLIRDPIVGNLLWLHQGWLILSLVTLSATVSMFTLPSQWLSMSLHYSYGGYNEEISCYWIGLAKIKYRFQGTSVSKEGLLFASNSSLNSSTENGEEELLHCQN